MFFRWAVGGQWRTFEPRPVDQRTMHGTAFPVCDRRAWRFRELVEDLMVRRECSQADAEGEARDVPWYQPHTCPTTEGEADVPRDT